MPIRTCMLLFIITANVWVASCGIARPKPTSDVEIEFEVFFGTLGVDSSTYSSKIYRSTTSSFISKNCNGTFDVKLEPLTPGEISKIFSIIEETDFFQLEGVVVGDPTRIPRDLYRIRIQKDDQENSVLFDSSNANFEFWKLREYLFWLSHEKRGAMEKVKNIAESKGVNWREICKAH